MVLKYHKCWKLYHCILIRPPSKNKTKTIKYIFTRGAQSEPNEQHLDTESKGATVGAR